MKQNKKFRCTNPDCIKHYKFSEGDNRLILHIEDNTYDEYFISDDGVLEHYDSDGNGQEFYMRCPRCDKRYNFDYRGFNISMRYILPLTKRELQDIECVDEY